MMTLLYTLQDKVEEIIVSISGIAVTLIMLLTTYDIIMRKIFGSGIPSLYEITEDYLMVAMIFLAISYVQRIGGHVRVTLFEKYIPRRYRPLIKKISDVLALVLFVLILVYGGQSAVEAFNAGELSTSELAYPMAPALFLVPIGAFLTCLRILKSLFTESKTLADGEDLSAD